MSAQQWAPLASATLALSLCAFVSPSAQTATQKASASMDGLDSTLRAFWSAERVTDADASARQIQASGVDFDTLSARLHAGPAYLPQKTGRVDMASSDADGPLDHVVDVPADYTPDRRWPVRIVLHGGVGRERPAVGEKPRPLSNRLPGSGEIVIQPRAWLESAWWTERGASNVIALLSHVKRLYNIDELRVHLTGISDGGTGVYFFAMREASPWSACLALNGHPLVLANEETGADGQLYAHNLVNCPLYLVNGGKDPLYPAQSVKPFVDMFKAGGVPVTWHVYPDAGHDVSWWPQEREPFEAFVAAHPRVAHPDTISWETERTDRYNRFRWLVIDRLGSRSSDVALADVNEYDSISASAGSRETRPTLFARRQPSGRADAVRKGNSIELRSRGVHDVTLLLSPDVIDFGKPVTVSVNGRRVYEGVVAKSSATLLKWAARDRDRTMLYGAELHVAVP